MWTQAAQTFNAEKYGDDILQRFWKKKQQIKLAESSWISSLLWQFVCEKVAVKLKDFNIPLHLNEVLN